MAVVAKVNGLVVEDTVYNTGNIKRFTLRVANTDITAEYADGGVVELILAVIQPTAFRWDQNGVHGECYFIRDGGADADDLQAKVRALGSSAGSIGGIDMTSTTVTDVNIV